jgi:hypothetical protein
MKQEKHDIDQLFREGFRQEANQVAGISREKFEAFFMEEKIQNISIWKRKTFRVSVAASWLLLAGFFIWHYNFKNADTHAVVKELSDEKPESLENLLAVAAVQSGKKGIREGTGLKPNIREKSNRKPPAPKVRNRRRQLPGPMLPGIFPTTLMAAAVLPQEIEPKNPDLNRQNMAASDAMQVSTTESVSDPEANAFDIVSIDVLPGRVDSPSEFGESAASGIVHNEREEVSSGFLPSEIEKVRNVEDAKAFLIRGIGRLIGVLPAAAVAQSSDSDKFKKL